MRRTQTALSPSLPTDLKYSNRTRIIHAFLFNGDALSVSDISAEVGLSRQTVMKSVQFFLNRGILVSAGKGASTAAGGKRPELFSLSPDKFFLCVTLWPQELRLHLYTIGRRAVDDMVLHAPLPADPKAAVDNVGQLAHRLLQKNAVALPDLCAVSLSTSGTLDYEKGLLKYSSQSPEWGADVPLRDYLRAYFAPGASIFLENAGKMTARPYLLDPQWSDKRILVIFSSWGLSSCLIEKGRILSGKNALIGEIGHMVIDPHDEERCGCGGHGCLERLVSPARIRAMVEKDAPLFPASPLPEGPLDRLTIPDLFAASAKADPLAREIADHLAFIFAAALRNIALVFDPDLIIFQGDYASADDHFDARMRHYLSEFQYFPASGPFEIRYDTRPLADLDALGSYTALALQYFEDPALYLDGGET